MKKGWLGFPGQPFVVVSVQSTERSRLTKNSRHNAYQAAPSAPSMAMSASKNALRAAMPKAVSLTPPVS